MKNIYRIPAALAAAIVLALTGCGGKPVSVNDADSPPAETSATEAVTTTAATTQTEPAAAPALTVGGEIAGLVYDDSANIWTSDDEQLAKFVNIMKNEVAKSPDIKGTYLLATDDRVLFVGGINSTEADGTTPVNACSTYEIGSVTKTFTAAAVLKLCEQGKLSLDDKLGKFIPEYEKGADITIYQLLHMRSGISREFFTTEELTDPELFKKYYNDGFTDEELIAALNENGLEFEPGSKMQYSNTNYMLLARVIEKVTGESFCDYIQKNIFDVCGMEHSSSMKVGDLTTVPEPPFEGQYEYDIYDVLPTGCFNDPHTSRGAGDIHSCAADLLAFDRALVNGKLLNEQSLNEMFDLVEGYGCGWQMFRRGEKNVYVHRGAAPLYASYNMYIKSEKYGNLYLIQLHPTFADTEYADTTQSNILLASKT